MFRACLLAIGLFAASFQSAAAQAQSLPSAAAMDAEVGRLMAVTNARGLALAVIDEGRPVHVRAYGERNARGQPLTEATVMYGASLTKAVFAWTVMQLVEEGVIDLDRPIGEYLPRPLPDYYDATIEDRYADYRGLADDPRWRAITPRILLTHSAGFSNFGFLEPDGRLRIHSSRARATPIRATG